MQTLLSTTLHQLRETSEPLSHLCRRAAVKERWLRRLMAGDYEDPGVNKIERLLRCLEDSRRDYSVPVHRSDEAA